MKSETFSVPKIDVSVLRGDDQEAKLEVAREIDEICRGHGFFYAANHGIDVDALVENTRKMHQIVPKSEKYNLAIQAYNPENENSRAGFYLSIGGKKAPESFCYLNPNFTEFHPRIAAGTPMHEVNVWPRVSGGEKWRAFFEEYYWQVFGLSQTLLKGFALALDQPERFFEHHFKQDDTLSAVSLIRYPFLENYPPLQTADDGTVLSFGDHLDVSLLTVLFQTPVPNLQVEVDGHYYDVPTSGDDFLINCGTYMEHLTDGRYPARRHRVIFVNEERLSLPFFVNLGHYDAPKLTCNERVGEVANDLKYGDYLMHGLGDLIIKNGQT